MFQWEIGLTGIEYIEQRPDKCGINRQIQHTEAVNMRKELEAL